MTKLYFDEKRENYPGTGIFVRAIRNEKWDSIDLAHLTKESLLDFLKDKPKDWSINTVGILLGHGHLTE